MRRASIKKDAQEELMRGLQAAISSVPDCLENAFNMDKRNEMIEQFRRIEKLLGFEPGTWKPFA